MANLTIATVLALSLLTPGRGASQSVSPNERARTIVTTDGEIDDRSSFIRFLLYTSDYDVEAIIATNSKWQLDGHGTDWMHETIDAYEQVEANLRVHDARYPTAAHLRSVVLRGNEDRSRLHAVGPDNDTPGSDRIIEILLDDDPRPVWLQAWGGTNTIAQALWRLGESYDARRYRKAIGKARIYAVSDQDATLYWIRDNVPDVTLIMSRQYVAVNYDHEGHPYSDHEIFSRDWMTQNVKSGHGPLGAMYPQSYFSEGDSPAFFHLLETGLRSREDPSYGGWGGRFVRDLGVAEYWSDAADDGDPLKPLWRWLLLIQNDFAARLDWASSGAFADANHAPDVIASTPTRIVAISGEIVELDASHSADPDGDSLAFRWWHYRDPGTPGITVAFTDTAGSSTAFVAPDVARPAEMHIILDVTDGGEPQLTRFARWIVNVVPRRGDRRRNLVEKTLSPWYPRVVDEDSGGYHSSFKHDWTRGATTDKFVVNQSRHVWTTAALAEFDRSNRDWYLDISAHGVEFLAESLWDSLNGGFHSFVSRDGTFRRQPGYFTEGKTAYGHAFAIYALAAYYRASGDQRALDLAREAFLWLDRAAHDAEHGGYFQFISDEGRPRLDGLRMHPPKDHNSSLHILEAFTTLYAVWPNDQLRTRLVEILRIVRDTLTHQNGHLRLYFSRDWTPLSYADSSRAAILENLWLDHVSFGHDVETAYLMMEAAELLEYEEDLTLKSAKKMVDHALDHGWDGRYGGFHDSAFYFDDDRPEVVKHHKTWWVQAEGINALITMSRFFPNDARDYGAKLDALVDYVDRYVLDHEHGGWFSAGLDRSPRQRTSSKANIWKAAYHDGRAVLNLSSHE